MSFSFPLFSPLLSPFPQSQYTVAVDSQFSAVSPLSAQVAVPPSCPFHCFPFPPFSAIGSPDESPSCPPSSPSLSPPFPIVPKSMFSRAVEFINIQLFGLRFTDSYVADPSLSCSTNCCSVGLGSRLFRDLAFSRVGHGRPARRVPLRAQYAADQ